MTKQVRPDARQLKQFHELAAVDPRLTTLLSHAQGADQGGASFCANSAFYGLEGYPSFKRRVAFLVGWRAGTPPVSPRDDNAGDTPESLTVAEQEALHHAVPELLCSQDAYDLVYDVVLRSLPPCRNCTCVAEDNSQASSEGE
jgi:hypothetical protein